MMGLYNENMDDDHSSAFIYSNRSPEDYQGEGMYPRQALNTLLNYGMCLHSTFPDLGTYSILKSKVTNDMKIEAKYHKIKGYAQIYTNEEVKFSVMNNGPATICVPIYDSFYDIKSDGILQNPDFKTEQFYGYHQMTIVGWEYINNDLYWLVLNSWGDKWGVGGYCKMHWRYPIMEKWSIIDTKEIIQPSNCVGSYYKIQLGAFRNYLSAYKLTDKIEKLTSLPIVINFENELYKVRIGEFNKKSEAVDICNFIRQSGYSDAFIIFN